MRKKVLYILLTLCVVINICSCTLFQKPMDKKSGFTDKLNQTESYIRNVDWENAKTSSIGSESTWKKLKPYFQIDVDHDYVNAIEEEFVKLGAYIDAKDLSNSLATVLLVKDTWENIGSM